MFKIVKCLFRIRMPVTCSQHLSVNLLLEITRRDTSVSARALQSSTMPISVILLFPKSKLSTFSLACCFRSWQIWLQWLSVRPLPDRSMSPIYAYNLKDSPRLNFYLPLAAAGFSFFSASCDTADFSFAFDFLLSSNFYGAISSAAGPSLIGRSFFCVALDLVLVGIFLRFAEFSRDIGPFLRLVGYASARLVCKFSIAVFTILLF